MTPLLAHRPRTDRAFERLYQRYVGDVYRYALVVLRNPDDAEDVTQTTFLNAYRAFQRGERPRTPQNWLMTIAHNVCRQRFRQSARRPNELPLEEDVADVVPEDDGPTAEDIRRALGHLAFNQRAAIVMRELEGRSYQEIADILGLSTSAVETLIFRARRALREQLEGGLTCHEAELAVSKQLDGRLARKDRAALRAHLRECEDCARFARSQRAQRSAIKSLALIPLPTSLSSFFGGGGGGAAAGAGAAGATAGAGIAAKVALVGATAAIATGVGYEGAKRAGWHPLGRSASKAAQVAPAAAQPAGTTTAVTEEIPSVARPVSRQTRKAAGTEAKATPGKPTEEIPGVKPKPKPGQAAAAPGQVKKEQAQELRAARRATATAHGRALGHARKPARKAHPVRPAHPQKPAARAHANPPKPQPEPKKRTETAPPPPPPPPPENNGGGHKK